MKNLKNDKEFKKLIAQLKSMREKKPNVGMCPCGNQAGNGYYTPPRCHNHVSMSEDEILRLEAIGLG